MVKTLSNEKITWKVLEENPFKCMLCNFNKADYRKVIQSEDRLLTLTLSLCKSCCKIDSERLFKFFS